MKQAFKKPGHPWPRAIFQRRYLKFYHPKLNTVAPRTQGTPRKAALFTRKRKWLDESPALLSDRRTTRRGHLIELSHRPEEDSRTQKYEDINGTEVLDRFPNVLSQDLPPTLAQPAAFTLISSLLAQDLMPPLFLGSAGEKRRGQPPAHVH